MDDSGIFETFLDQSNMEQLQIKMEPQSPPLYANNSNSNTNNIFQTTNINNGNSNNNNNEINTSTSGVTGINQLINNNLNNRINSTTTTNTNNNINNNNNTNNNNSGGVSSVVGLGLPSMLSLPTQQILSSIPTPTDIQNSAAENIQQLIQHSAFNPNSLYYYTAPTSSGQTSSTSSSSLSSLSSNSSSIPNVNGSLTSIMESMPTSPSQACGDVQTTAPSMMINSVHHQLINHHLQQQQQHQYQIKQEQEQQQQNNTIIPIHSTTAASVTNNSPSPLNIHNLHHNYQPANQFLQSYQLLPQTTTTTNNNGNRSIFIQSNNQPHINLTTPSEIELLSPTSSTSTPNISSSPSPLVHNQNNISSFYQDIQLQQLQLQQLQQQNQQQITSPTISTDIHSQIANSPYLTQLNSTNLNTNDSSILTSPLLYGNSNNNNFTTTTTTTNTSNNLLGQPSSQQQSQTSQQQQQQTTNTTTTTTTTTNNFIPMAQPPIMIVGDLDIIIEQQPPSDVRTRTPNDRRTFNSVIRVVGDLAKNKVGGVLAQLAYGNSTTERPSQFILGGNKIGVIGKDGKVAFDSLSMTEASTKHRENEFCLEYVLISEDNRIYTTPNGPFIKRSRPFYAYSNQKVLSRRRNVTLRTLSSNRGTTLGGDQMHVVGSPFIRCNSLKCIFHTPHGDVPASNIELYSESVLFFTLPPYPIPPNFNSPEGTELPVQVVITNDGRNFSNPLSFTYIYENTHQKRLRSRF